MQRNRVSPGRRDPLSRQTPAYGDEVSAEFVRKQQDHVDRLRPANFELTPVTEDGW